MGIISLSNTDRLLWLGRYTERVYTTVRIFSRYFDTIIDQGEEGIAEFCSRLDIPNIYPDGESFVEHYCFDKDDPNSIAANLIRAYDNAVTLRETIGTEAVSYIQLAIYDLEKAHGNRAPLMGLQRMVDHILAFWGITDDRIENENVRNIIKAGKRIERVDMYCRLQVSNEDIEREVYRMTDRLKKTDLKYDTDKAKWLNNMAKADNPNWRVMVNLVESLLEV